MLYDLFVQLPSQVLFAKMIPSNIEASMFSIQAGVINFGNFFLSIQLANFINLFVGVNSDHLKELWKLFAIQCCCSLIPLVFLWLIPTRKQVAEVQKVI